MERLTQSEFKELLRAKMEGTTVRKELLEKVERIESEQRERLRDQKSK